MKSIAFLLSLVFSHQVFAVNLENVHWGFDAKPSLLFDSQEQCASAAMKALEQQSFNVRKTSNPEDGPILFADAPNKSQKALVKCLLATGTVVTTVIGARDNLSKANAINADIEKIYLQGQLATVDNWQAHLVSYPEVEKVPAMHGHVVLDSPTRAARIIKQIETPSLVGCAAYVDTAEGRFYMSEFSLKRYEEGQVPSWIFIFPSVKP